MPEKNYTFLFALILSTGAFSQSVGIGTTQFVPKNTLDVAGGVAIGAGYAGGSTAPSNGLIVEGFIGAATNSAYCPLTISYVSAGSPGISNDVIFEPGTTGTGHEALFNVAAAENASNDPNGLYAGILNLIEPGNSNSYGKLIGTYNWLHGGIGSATTAGSYGCYNVITSGFGETVDTLFGVYNLLLQTSGVSSPAAFGNYTKVALDLAFSSSFGDVYGDYVTAQSGTSVSTIYGLYVDDLASKVTGTAYGVYCEGTQKNYFGGNVGIGTSNPTAKLHVVGDICYTGSIGSCSDIRYKKNILPLENILPKVLSLRPVTYDWKRDEFPENNFSTDNQIGLIAQEVENIFPQLVLTDNRGYKSVDYSRLTPILLEAIKEQQKKINDLASNMNDLKQEIQILKEHIYIKTEKAEVSGK